MIPGTLASLSTSLMRPFADLAFSKPGARRSVPPLPVLPYANLGGLFGP